MTPSSNQKASQLHLPRHVAPPTQSGLYWFQGEMMHWEMMVHVRLTNGQLMVWWLNQDEPVANMKGAWRGPLLPFSDPDSE